MKCHILACGCACSCIAWFEIRASNSSQECTYLSQELLYRALNWSNCDISVRAWQSSPITYNATKIMGVTVLQNLRLFASNNYVCNFECLPLPLLHT